MNTNPTIALKAAEIEILRQRAGRANDAGLSADADRLARELQQFITELKCHYDYQPEFKKALDQARRDLSALEHGREALVSAAIVIDGHAGRLLELMDDFAARVEAYRKLASDNGISTTALNDWRGVVAERIAGKSNRRLAVSLPTFESMRDAGWPR